MNTELIREAANHLNIEAVNLCANSVALDPNFNPRMDQGEIGLSLEWGTRRTVLAKMQRVGTEEFDLVWHVWFRGVARLYRGEVKEEASERPAPLAEISADFLLQYSFRDDWTPNPEALHEFSIHNVPIHVWPYWREWVNNVTMRIGLPSVILSMHMLPPSKDVPFSQVTVEKALEEERPGAE